MPKYYEYKVCGYYLYYTSHCVINKEELCKRGLLHCITLLFQSRIFLLSVRSNK